MGDRAVITTRAGWESRNDNLGVYLHWCGQKECVSAFLAYCKMKGCPPPEADCYGWARLCQVTGNFLGGSDCVGIDVVSRLECDNFDNGVYIIENWEITGRELCDPDEDADCGDREFEKLLIDIDAHQPKKDQLGKRRIRSLLG